ncbi:putative sulfate/molybdate transporter [Roseococcus sp. MDT2-1-1]|uniref:Sulfate/molybdate transporter n=2 Tax=Sabulicella glaciei TaxID=2984948 RepID=A0ABT3NZI9_9PROT|nr:putative sulfate/molybdate transporter [Roseococcus sp. MDT2-1-1]MCW8087582.1 putative sulfate/molybdate transporter [Roseococcus sp. MDT2-1-1]
MGEVGGAFGDLGTLLPILLGAIAVAGMSAGGVLVGFGAFLLATGLIYRLPMPVQPMKAVGALVIAGGLAPGEVAAAGIAGGLILLALTLSGAIAWAARVVPRSAVLGLQLGVGATMAWIGLGLAWTGPLAAGIALLLLLGLPRLVPGLPAVPLALLGAIALDLAAGGALPPLPVPSFALPEIVLPGGFEEAWRGLVVGALPQLPLTLANAVLLPALLAREMFPPAEAARAAERRIGVVTGTANTLLAPLGALPMCHGAGGLVAQYHFGARTGWAPALLGLTLLALGLFFAADAARLLGAIPAGALGALLILAGSDLAMSRKLMEARAECRPAIAAAALTAFVLNPALGLAAGWLVEGARTLLRLEPRRANDS